LIQVSERVLQELSVPRVRTRFHFLQHFLSRETETLFFPEESGFHPAHLWTARARLFPCLRLLRFHRFAFPPSGHSPIIVLPESSAAWELIAAAQGSHSDTRAHARAWLASSHHLCGVSCSLNLARQTETLLLPPENDMNAPYGLEIVDNCLECANTSPGFSCGLSQAALESLKLISHRSTLPAGAILFVEGQSPRGMFILCSGRVNLSTTPREGKILMLKTAEAGKALGLSAAISGLGYETTAETATPSQLNFVDRRHLLELIQSQSEVGLHTAQFLSRGFHAAYRDIHDLVLSRSSAGKLARLLLSQSRRALAEEVESRIHSSISHEEMAQRMVRPARP
jgi:CRP/FNR family transcriptional regulator, cyclic AMP receptor protein